MARRTPGPPLPQRAPGRHRDGCLRLGITYGLLFSAVLFWLPLALIIRFA